MIWKSSIMIGQRQINLKSPTYFIADIAANHDGDLDRAVNLVRLAKEAGADCAKFQHFVAGKIVSGAGFTQLGQQQAHQSSWKKSVVETYDQYHTPRTWTDTLVAACRKVGIDYMTTPYDFEAVEMQSPFVPAFKIGSGDITWLELIDKISSSGKPVLLATGASTLAEVEVAVNTVLKRTDKIILLQCNTNYSGSLSNFDCVNLRVLETFARRWPGILLGLSDHTPGSEAALGAIALGARVIEKHFTDDNEREGPDHSFAMNTLTWQSMVMSARRLERALGNGEKIVESNEISTVVVQRRAVRAATTLSAGHVLRREDLDVLRPCPNGAIDAHDLPQLVGRVLRKSVAKEGALTWFDVI